MKPNLSILLIVLLSLAVVGRAAPAGEPTNAKEAVRQQAQTSSITPAMLAAEAKRKAVIYDYVDSSVPMLARMADKRLAGYRALGYEIAAVKHD